MINLQYIANTKDPDLGKATFYRNSIDTTLLVIDDVTFSELQNIQRAFENFEKEIKAEVSQTLINLIKINI